MPNVSEMAIPAALTGLELIPGLQGDDDVGIPLLAHGTILPRGDLLLLRRPFVADTASTTSGDPGAGNVRWNHATQTLATEIIIDDADAAAGDVSGVWASLQLDGFLYLQGVVESARAIYQKWQVTAKSDEAGYGKLTVSLVSSNGSFSDDDAMELTLQQPDPAAAGSTQGRQAIYIAAGAMRPSATGGCAPLAAIPGAAGQPDVVSLDFDSATQEYAQFAFAMPKKWNEGTITFVPHWSHAATSTNFGVCWNLQAVAVSNDDTMAVNFGAAQTSVDTGGTTNDLYRGPESSAVTVGGSPAAEDMAYFRFSRVPSDGGDTMAIDARLHGITIYVTTAADTDA